MKKLTLILLSILMIVTLASCNKDNTECKHTLADDDGDCTTPVSCSDCGEIMEEGREEHYFIYQLGESSENVSTFGGRCEYCREPAQNAVTITVEHGSVSLFKQMETENEVVFLFTNQDEKYKMYGYKLDAKGNEDAYIAIRFYPEEACEGYNASDYGYGLLEGEVYTCLNNQYVGIQVKNHSGEPVELTLSITPKE